jgi:hypothetical protein
LPLFLFLWPLALLAAPVLLLVGLILLRPVRLALVSYQLFCALRGLDIDIRQPGNVVQLKFI